MLTTRTSAMSIHWHWCLVQCRWMWPRPVSELNAFDARYWPNWGASTVWMWSFHCSPNWGERCDCCWRQPCVLSYCHAIPTVRSLRYRWNLFVVSQRVPNAGDWTPWWAAKSVSNFAWASRCRHGMWSAWSHRCWFCSACWPTLCPDCCCWWPAPISSSTSGTRSLTDS